MARVKLTAELKEAVSYLSSKEKDKLLYRLLAKEPLLVEQLIFKLLEDNNSSEERRKVIADMIREGIANNAYFSPSILLYYIKDYSSQITFHTRATKDKLGEVELNLLMLTEALNKHQFDLELESPKKMRTLNKYILQRCLKLMDLINALHEDYRLEFEDSLIELAKAFTGIESLMKAAIFIGFDINWFYNFDLDRDTKPNKQHLKLL